MLNKNVLIPDILVGFVGKGTPPSTFLLKAEKPTS